MQFSSVTFTKLKIEILHDISEQVQSRAHVPLLKMEQWTQLSSKSTLICCYKQKTPLILGLLLISVWGDRLFRTGMIGQNNAFL